MSVSCIQKPDSDVRLQVRFQHKISQEQMEAVHKADCGSPAKLQPGHPQTAINSTVADFIVYNVFLHWCNLGLS